MDILKQARLKKCLKAVSLRNIHFVKYACIKEKRFTKKIIQQKLN
jgi:hypothetical protein